MKIDKISNMMAQDKPIELIAERYGVGEREVVEFIAENLSITLDEYSSGRVSFEGEDSIIAAREAYLMSLLEDSTMVNDEELE